MPFVIRAPLVADAPRIADLHVETWRETYTHLLPEGFFTEEHRAGRRELWERILSTPREDWSTRIAETADGTLVGFACAGPSQGPEGTEHARERQLYMLYVSAAQHGTGLGRDLLREVLGDEPAQLWVAKENPRAVAFYRRQGFAFDGVEQIDPGAPAITDARMVR